MKKTNRFLMLSVLVLSTLVQAGPDRKGFFLGLGLGGGYMKNPVDKGGAANANFRIGGGISDDFLLMYEGTAFSSIEDEPRLITYASYVAAQYFIPGTNGFYIRPGVGMGKIKAEQTAFGTTVSATSDFGLALKGSAGYELKFGLFGLGLEGTYEFMRIEGDNINNFGGAINGTFYF